MAQVMTRGMVTSNNISERKWIIAQLSTYYCNFAYDKAFYLDLMILVIDL